MDFRFTAAQEKFRREIREFLRQEMTPELRKAIEALRRGGVPEVTIGKLMGGNAARAYGIERQAAVS